MKTGSRFLWDLANWNQGSDDLREADALVIAGNGGTYGGVQGGGDGLVGLSSAALTHSLPDEKVRIIPYCHTTSDLLHQLGYCPQPPKSIAMVENEDHPSWRIIGPFLLGGDGWKTVGHTPSRDPVLTKTSGLFLAARDEKDQWVGDLTGTYGEGKTPLTVGPAPLLFEDFLPVATAAVQASRSGAAASVPVPASKGGYRTALWKTGPRVAAVIPTAGLVETLNRAPGTMISIYGASLASRSESFRGLPLPATLAGTQVLMDGKPLALYFAGPGQINAVLPERATGYASLIVKTEAGEHAWPLMLDAAAPAVFSLDMSGRGPAAAVRHRDGQVVTASTPVTPGEYILLYLTGLGPVRERDGLQWALAQPQVLIDGQPALVLFAGRAPGYPGMDQINLQIPYTVRVGDIGVVVESQGHSSNRVTLTVR
jgi:uncharacterized protein (TIGR03437 family)